MGYPRPPQQENPRRRPEGFQRQPPRRLSAGSLGKKAVLHTMNRQPPPPQPPPVGRGQRKKGMLLPCSTRIPFSPDAGICALAEVS
eukprot:gene6430-biopygen19397